MTDKLEENLAAVRDRISAAAARFGRNPADVRLLAVTKSVTPEAIRQAFELGQTRFGENYPQEAVKKIEGLRGLSIEWHFIGRLQSNKTRAVAERFAWVHTVDRPEIARRLSDQRPADLPLLNVCLQYNVSQEITKGGVASDELMALAETVAALPRLKLRGLMALPAPSEQFEAQRAGFREVREAFEALCGRGLALDTLSMGTSGDLEAAVAENATLVRVGTAIFGPRPLK